MRGENMKKNVIRILVCVACLVMGMPARAVMGSAVAAVTESTSPSISGPTPIQGATVAPTKPKSGWETLKNGQKRYYRDGRYVTGLQTIGRKQYFFSAKGYLLRDAWGTAGGKRYRTDRRGVIIKDKLIRVKDKVYYMDSKGAMKKGWKTFKTGKSYFGSNGVRMTGLRKIGKTRYYFDKKGIMQKKCWKTFKSGKFYFKANGAGAVGLTKIGKDYYYFNGKGVMKKGTTKVRTTIYYLDEKGVLQARKEKSQYYNANGTKMDSLQVQDFETLQRARAIVGQITTPQMTQAQRLKTCFDWVIRKPYVTRRPFSNFSGWPAVYANDHFVLNGGNCQADAAAFAYMAKALGYKNIYVCADSDGTYGLAHSWAEVDGLVYDPLFAEAKSYSGNYGVVYGVYTLRPVLHIAI